MAIGQGQQGVGAAREQGGIPLAEQDHRQPLLRLGRQGIGGLTPGLLPRLSLGHHREEQGQPPLFRRDPRRGNLRRHALGVGARDRVGDNVRGLDGLNRRQGQQVGVTGTNPHQGDCRGRAGAHGRGAQSAPF